MIRRAPVTMMILVVIAIVFTFEVMTDPTFGEETLIRLGAILPWTVVAQRGEYWRLVAAMFLHAGWLHWAVNSWALYQLGMLYESLFGSPRFALIYFASGLCASLASSMAGHGPAVGASGAIFGILGAFIFSIRRSPQYRHQPWTRGLIGQLIFWILVNIGIGLYFPFIDNVAHMAGLATGLLLGFLPHRVPPSPPGNLVIDVASVPPQNQP